MKKIIIPASTSFFVRNFLRNGFASALRDAGFAPVFLAPAEKLSYYREQFTAEGVVFDALPEASALRADRFFKKLEGWSIHSRFVALAHWYYLLRPDAQEWLPVRLILFPVRMALWQLGRLRLWRTFVRVLFSLVPHRPIREFLLLRRPDAVFCPFMNVGQEWHFLKEAKKLGIMTIGMTPSWDNFCSKTFLRVQPDTLLVQTNLMREQAVSFADYPRENITVTGVPQYDRYFLRHGIMPREAFLQSIGADPRKKLIVYACSGKITYAVDVAMLPILHRIITRGDFPLPAQVLVRPHPKRVLASVVLEHARRAYGFIAEEPASRLAVSRDPWEFDERALSLLANTLAHADLVITTCTTFFVEAAIFGAPLIAIGFDPGKKRLYANSARRFFEWEHLADLGRTGGVSRIESEAELAPAARAYLADKTLHADGRKRVVAEQAVFTDGKSLARIVAALRAIVYH